MANEAAANVIDLKLEAIVLPVADVDRADAFYRGLGWRVDADIRTADSGRILQSRRRAHPVRC